MNNPPKFCRSDMLKRFASSGKVDLVIIGGGIHGASLARQASAVGLEVILLEAKDFGYGLSSRSSKMLHGGVRYLEHGHVGLVKEALEERAYQMLQAPHLCRAQRFIFPALSRSPRPSWQMWLGLGLYSLLSKIFSPRGISREITSQFVNHKVLGSRSSQYRILNAFGCTPSTMIQYADGQMDDTRLVVENCIEAAHNGACVLNKARVENIEYEQEEWRVEARDSVDGSSLECRSRFLVNLAGPWVKEVHECWKPWQDDWAQPVYVRGTHLLFDFSWPTDGLIVPSRESGRYYFVWPYFSAAGNGTLVGPTSVLCPENEDDCQPTEVEIEELLGYLSEDFPYAEFNRERLVHAFAGMRILAGPSRKEAAAKDIVASKVSRDDVFIEQTNYLALLGGKYTTSRKTAESILRLVLKQLKASVSESELREIRYKQLPGAYGLEAQGGIEEIINKLLGLVPQTRDNDELRKLVVASAKLFGVRALLLESYNIATEDDSEAISQFVAGITRFCVEQESALDLRDVLARLGWDDFAELEKAYAPIITKEISLQRV